MTRYVVFIKSLHRSLNKNTIKRVEVSAESILAASRMACEMSPNLGVTPTEVSMVWPVWPPSPRQHRAGETK